MKLTASYMHKLELPSHVTLEEETSRFDPQEFHLMHLISVEHLFEIGLMRLLHIFLTELKKLEVKYRGNLNAQMLNDNCTQS